MIVRRDQLMIALVRAGRYRAARDWSGSVDFETSVTWSEAPTFDSTWPIVSSMATALGMSGSDVTALFQAASEINP